MRVYYRQQHPGRLRLHGGAGARERGVEGRRWRSRPARWAPRTRRNRPASPPQTFQHLRIAEARLTRWRALLRRLGEGIDRRRLYAPAASPLGRDIVTWPS
ncbi:MAG: hypothetical protein U0531_13100 [Dehalococcoidia bacterium]